MRTRESLAELQAEIAKTRELLGKNRAFYRSFSASDLKWLGRKNSSAMVMADIITDHYTCIETLFLRVSQFFENELGKEGWHKELLHKMTLDIKGVRKRVISEDTFAILGELLRFRHFRRYYFEMEYDWDRIDFLLRKYEALESLLEADLHRFREFLEELKAHVKE